MASPQTSPPAATPAGDFPGRSAAHRLRLPGRRQVRRAKATWSVANAELTVYVDVGFGFVGAAGLRHCGWLPLEIFLVAGKTGSMVNFAAQDVAETLSLLLQHGYGLDELAERFKPGSLASFAVAQAAELAAAFARELAEAS